MSDAHKTAHARAKRAEIHAAAAAADRRRRNVQWLAGAVFAAVVVVVVAVIVVGGTGERNATEASGSVEGTQATTQLLRGIPQDGLALGNAKAPVTVLEFVDVQCPICRDHQLDEQPRIIAELVRTGKARLVAQPVTLPMMGEGSVAGRAVALRLARKDRAWEFLNLFYWNQGPEGSGYVTPDYLTRLLAEIPSATPADIARTVDAPDRKVAEAIDAAFEAQARKAQAAGVPSSRFGTPWFAVGRTGAAFSTYEPVIRDGVGNAEAVIKAAQELS